MSQAETLVPASSAAFVRSSSPEAMRAGLAGRFTLWSSGNSLYRRARRLAPFAASGVGLWLCVRFCNALDWHAVVRDLRHVGVGAALLVLAPLVGHFVHMIGWRALLPVPARPGLARSLAISLAAQAGNEIGLGVLGESLKVSEFRSEHRGVALRAMLLDNVTAFAALLAVVLSMAAFLGGAANPRALPAPLAVALLGALLSALFGAVALWERKQRGASNGVLAAFAAHYLGKLWIVAEFALVLALLGPVTLRSSAVLGLVSTLASAVGAAIPGQLGVLEAALKGSAASCGLGVCTLVSVALLRRARSVLWVALGALLFWQLRVQRSAPPTLSPAE